MELSLHYRDKQFYQAPAVGMVRVAPSPAQQKPAQWQSAVGGVWMPGRVLDLVGLKCGQ